MMIIPKERGHMTHRIKCIKRAYEQVRNGWKTFEVRIDDRDYQPGDTVELIETVSVECPFETGHYLQKRIGYVLRGELAEQFGIQPGYCVFSLLEVLHG